MKPPCKGRRADSESVIVTTLHESHEKRPACVAQWSSCQVTPHRRDHGRIPVADRSEPQIYWAAEHVQHIMRLRAKEDTLDISASQRLHGRKNSMRGLCRTGAVGPEAGTRDVIALKANSKALYCCHYRQGQAIVSAYRVPPSRYPIMHRITTCGPRLAARGLHMTCPPPALLSPHPYHTR